MTDMNVSDADLEDDFGGYTAEEVAQLCDRLANAAERGNANSGQEIASISRRAAAAIRYLMQISGYGTSAHD
jgi:hypothetical protein